MKDILVIIPSLDPTIYLPQVVNNLIENDLTNILVIDDGSENKEYFNELKHKCTVITHKTNQGKGSALKTGFKYALTHPEINKVITVDSDNQHHIDDIVNIANTKINKNTIILGVRNFDEKNIPLRSKIGNKLTSTIFHIITQNKINDTQTGLRLIQKDNLNQLLKIPGERFEYETNVLLNINNLKIQQIPIQTIYLNKNETSHFKPFKDSLKIYMTILKHLTRKK